jgi:hypothetical protein
VEIKPGDIYTRHKDGVVYRVKWFDSKTVVLESQDGSLLSMTDIYGLANAYTRRESKVAQ